MVIQILIQILLQLVLHIQLLKLLWIQMWILMRMLMWIWMQKLMQMLMQMLMHMRMHMLKQIRMQIYLWHCKQQIRRYLGKHAAAKSAVIRVEDNGASAPGNVRVMCAQPTNSQDNRKEGRLSHIKGQYLTVFPQVNYQMVGF